MNFKQKLFLKLAQRKADWPNEHRLPKGRVKRDKTVYIIRRSGRKLGLFSFVETNISRIRYAIDNNMIPVVDMCNFDNALKTDANDNPWDDYFEQPAELSLEEAYDSKDIIISDSGIPEDRPTDEVDFLYGKTGDIDGWREVFRKYIRLKPEVSEYAGKRYGELIGKDDKVLGVLARGTDYLKLKPSKHPVQPEPQQLIDKVKEELEQGYNKIFLATEDKGIAELFKNTFGDKCVTNDREYIDYTDGFLCGEENAKSSIRMNKNLDYITNLFILGKCDGIVAGRTSGTVGAALMSEGWDRKFFFELGTYE